MPRVIASTTLEASREETTFFVTCWRLTLENGDVQGYTSHVKDLIVSSVTYNAATGYTPTSIDSSNRFNVDNLDVEGIISGDGVTVENIQAGVFDAARLKMFLVDPRNPDAGQVVLRTGVVGNIIRKDGDEFMAEVRGLFQRLQQTVTEVYTPACQAEFGSDRCKVQVSAPYWTSGTVTSAFVSGDAGGGTVSFVRSNTLTSRVFKATTDGTTGTSEPAFSSTVGATVSDGSVVWETMYAYKRSAVVSSVTNRRNFKCAGMDEPTNHWKLGTCTFKTGANAGRDMDIKKNETSGHIKLYMPMVSNIDAGDVVVLQQGCAHRMIDDCKNKYNNIYNFRGVPFMPGSDSLAGGTKT